MVSFFVLFISMRIVYGDYQCLCNYNETSVYAYTSTSSSTRGYLYEFDCKPLAEHPSSNADFIAVQFEKQVGYVYYDPPQMRKETCPGNPHVADIVPPPSQPDQTTESPISSSLTTASVPHFDSSSRSDPTISTTVSVPDFDRSSTSDPTTSISKPQITPIVSKRTVPSLPVSKSTSTAFTSAHNRRTTTDVFTKSSILSAISVASLAVTQSSTSTSRVPPTHGSTSEKSSSTAHTPVTSTPQSTTTRSTTTTMTRSTQDMTTRQSPSTAHTTTSKTTTPSPTTPPPTTTATTTRPTTPPTTTTTATTAPPSTTPSTTTTTTTPTTTTASTSAATKAMIYKMTSTHSTTASGAVTASGASNIPGSTLKSQQIIYKTKADKGVVVGLAFAMLIVGLLGGAVGLHFFKKVRERREMYFVSDDEM